MEKKASLILQEQDQDIQKLSPRMIVEKTERSEIFNCLICMKVILDPKECSGDCEQPYCGDCVAKISDQKCPKCRSDKGFKNLHRYVKADLDAIKFKCHREELCGKTHSYEEAIQHLKACEYRKVKCQYGCRHVMYQKDVQEHE